MDYLVTTQTFAYVLVVSGTGMIVSVVRKEWGVFGVFACLALIGAIGFVYRYLGGV